MNHTWVLPLCCRHNEEQRSRKLRRHTNRPLEQNGKVKEKPFRDWRWIVSTFWMMIKTGMFADFTHLSLAFQSLFNFLFPLNFLFWFFSSANMNIMLTTVVKTHRLSRVCVCVCTWGWKHLNRNHKCTSNILTHSRSRPSLPGTVKPPRQLLLLLLLHGTNNRNNTLCYSYYYVLICHASSLQYCFYISLYYTERRKKSDQGAGSCWISHTQCQTNFYSWFYSLWVDTKGVLLLSLSHKIMVMIVIAIFIIIIKKKTHSQGITNIMNQRGPNVMFEII